MKIYKHRHFYQWAKKEKLKDEQLKEAITEIVAGLHDGDLGNGLYKKRISQPGKGKRGSYRTLLAFKAGHKAFFVYGFAKKDLANINEKEQYTYRQLAKYLLAADEKVIQKMLDDHSLIEVK